jgi:hypothetical protein
MDIVGRACWYASWCTACGYKVAARRWIEEVILFAGAQRRTPDLLQRLLGVEPDPDRLLS